MFLPYRRLYVLVDYTFLSPQAVCVDRDVHYLPKTPRQLQSVNQRPSAWYQSSTEHRCDARDFTIIANNRRVSRPVKLLPVNSTAVKE